MKRRRVAGSSAAPTGSSAAAASSAPGISRGASPIPDGDETTTTTAAGTKAMSPQEQAEVMSSVFRVVEACKKKSSSVAVAAAAGASSVVAQAAGGETGAACTGEEIEEATGVRIAFTADEQAESSVGRAIFEALARNPLVSVDIASKTVRYQHELANVRDVREFVELKARGVSRDAMLEHNTAEWTTRIAEVVHDATVLAVRQGKLNNLVMFPRGTNFLVPLSVRVSASEGETYLRTTGDARAEVKRGETIIVAGKAYRVSSEPASDGAAMKRATLAAARASGALGVKVPPVDYPSTDEWLKRLETPYSSTWAPSSRMRGGTATTATSSSSSTPTEPTTTTRGGFALDFDEKRIPIHPAFRGPAVTDAVVLRHGCTADVRTRWHEIASLPNNNFKITDKTRLDRRLKDEGIVSEEKLREYNRADTERAARTAAAQAAAAASAGTKRRRARTSEPKLSSNAHMVGR